MSKSSTRMQKIEYTVSRTAGIGGPQGHAMTQPIFIPLDGSAMSEQAVPLGVSLARHLAREVILLRIVPPPAHLHPFVRDTEYTAKELIDPLHADAERYLDTIAAQIVEAGIAVRSYVIEGHTAHTVVEMGQRHDAGYIMMTTHGRSGLARWALGSTADRVLQLTECPLILFRPRAVTDFNLMDLPVYDRIIVPLDGSAPAEQALPHALRLATAYDAQILLFRVLLHPPPHLPEPQASAVRSAYEQTVGREAREYLVNLMIQLSADNVDVNFDIGVEPVADAILTFARDTDADLIAMTSHAREGLSRTVLGSVTDRVVRAGQVPVLITKP